MESTLAIREQMALTPAEVVENASTQARLLMDIVEKTKSYQQIAGKKYLQVEAWETIGAFNRVHAVTESITPIVRDGATVGYDAKVNLVNAGGSVVGAAIMPCYFTENACKGKEGDAKDKACKSAAQTFATSKAYRMNFSYVAILAGYQPLPAEELNEEREVKPAPQGDHFCKIHGVAFFKSGNMRGYAHKLEGGGWCNEDAAPASQPPVAGKDATPRPEPVIDMAWLKESLERLNWSDAGKYLKNKYGVNGAKVSDMVLALTPEHQREFEAEVKNRLEMV